MPYLLKCIPRSIQYAKSPAISFKSVSQGNGERFNEYADILGIQNASLLAPDLGGALYFSKLHIYDLAGLCDKNIAILINSGDQTALSNYILNELQPTFIRVHGPWSVRSGLFENVRFREMYTTIHEHFDDNNIYSGEYILKTAMPSTKTLEALKNK